jgi:PKD repeat protein
VTSTKRYNDGVWHHVVASLGPSGMDLYVDGKLVGSRTDTTSAQSYSGYWRIGGDSPWGNTAAYFDGRIDEVAIYPAALSADQVLNHYTIGSTGEASNVAPTAAFTSSTSQLTASFDASGSTDPDGTIASATWTFGDGMTGAGTTTTHTYAQAGTYAVTLTVTDDDGVSAQRTGSVTVTAPPPNVAPMASFTSAVSGLAVTVDGAGSHDSDGSVASYAWDFGDGATGSGTTTSHAYTVAGTYQVTLTVTDDDGATGTVTQPVTVTAPDPGTGEEPVAIAADAFERTVTNGFGSAQTGGVWSVSGGARSVSGGVGHLQVNAAGGSSAAWLNAVSVSDAAIQMGISLDAAPTGAGTYVYVVGRRTSGGHYRGVVRFLADGTVRLGLSRVVANAETTLRTVVLPGTYTPGTVLQVRLDLSGTDTTTLNAKAWATGTPEPTAWQVSATDTTASLQSPGSVGVTAYISGSATSVPVRVNVDDLWAGPAGTAPRVD